jgi:hypothetical protein
LRWGTANRERWTVHVFSQTQILMWIVALLTLEVFHLNLAERVELRQVRAQEPRLRLPRPLAEVPLTA